MDTIAMTPAQAQMLLDSMKGATYSASSMDLMRRLRDLAAKA